MYLPMGGLNCSIMTVESGKLFVLDLMRAIIATADDSLCPFSARSHQKLPAPSTPVALRVLRSAHSQTLLVDSSTVSSKV